MKYTARYAHLRTPSTLEIGSTVTRNQIIGVMGNTGCSSGPHLHLDVIHGIRSALWRLKDMGIKPNRKKVTADLKQLLYCAEGAFKTPYSITTVWDCPYYLRDRRVRHLSLDIIPTGEDWTILWSRSHNGKVIAKGYDKGYGNYILIGFEA